MRNTYSRSSRSPAQRIPWLWIGALIGILVLMFLLKMLMGGKDTRTTDTSYLTVSPTSPASIVSIRMTESSRNKLSGTGASKLYVGDYGVAVESGGAHVSGTGMSMDLDKNTELAYISQTGSVANMRFTKGQLWLSQESESARLEMKNATIVTDAGDVVMLEQNNQIYSKIYMISGDGLIKTTIGDYTLKAGHQMMISASDLANPSLKLDSLVGSIDEGIAQSPLFIKNDGKTLLESSLKVNMPTASGMTGTTTSSGGTATSVQYISITDPKDGSIAQTSKINIQGTLVSKDVKRVTFNEKDAEVSPVNETFTYQNLEITSEVNNVVYKVYGANSTLLEKGVITIYGSKAAVQGSNKLVPNSSPISSKDFKIVAPAANPYMTTESLIRVQGTVPKDRVEYIVVNGYRLQKYTAGSTSWYYFANTATETLKEGINSYTIKFYGPGDALLYTQIFSIIKESKNATTQSGNAQ